MGEAVVGRRSCGAGRARGRVQERSPGELVVCRVRRSWERQRQAGQQGYHERERPMWVRRRTCCCEATDPLIWELRSLCPIGAGTMGSRPHFSSGAPSPRDVGVRCGLAAASGYKQQYRASLASARGALRRVRAKRSIVSTALAGMARSPTADIRLLRLDQITGRGRPSARVPGSFPCRSLGVAIGLPANGPV